MESEHTQIPQLLHLKHHCQGPKEHLISMPVARILINTHGSLNRIVIIPVLDQTFIHQFICMNIDDCTVTVEKVHGIFPFSFHHFQGFFYIPLYPGCGDTVHQCHREKKNCNQNKKYFDKRFQFFYSSHFLVSCPSS